ncbi:Autophagy- protein 33 [Purpureocillium takamizusanense]|uniref:Autophagy- protein 33 n=1 Tax=Purpureocillium takamizusanense TaxID=2060973 RepID=A0A9Q8Q8A2_9HYPO|nr:Autophagy- protein 33 [Purpureocillium takamizusanense]UNI14910.1 Autophagy- protein 33 [Purpureocillium takamizusanense]
MVCAGARAISVLKFVGTVSLGLLTGVSYTVSAVSLPSLLRLPSSSSASQAVASLVDSLARPLRALTALSSAPLLLAFVLAPRSSRHPYLLYSSLLALIASAAPRLLPRPAAPPATPRQRSPKKQSPARRMEASYEVLGDVTSEAASEEDIEDVNGEEVRVEVEALARRYVVQTGLSALGFAMAVVGLWGDGFQQVVAYVS